MNIQKSDIERVDNTIYTEVNGKIVQYDVLDDDIDGAMQQFAVALNICETNEQIKRHMEINGYPGSLDVYEV